jgi:FMN phosphatase YigB (HAD superfamily)
LHQVRAITFDLDDTLWPIEPVIRRAETLLREWLAENYPAIPQNFSSAELLEVRKQVIEEFSDRCHDLRFLRKTVLGRVALASGYNEDLVDPAFDVFDAARNTVEIFPDVLPALQLLANEFTLVAVTNGNANLQTIGIRHLFHDVVTAVDAGAAKPERPIFDEAVRRAGVSAG